jgi:leucyl-tRNA---protein transferase
MEDIVFFASYPANIIQDMYFAERLSLKKWDSMLAEGWRHNGMMVFRTSHDIDEDSTLNNIIPLRNRLKNFQFSKSQRIIYKRNQDLTHFIRPTVIDDQKHDLFFRHIEKFKNRKPSAIWDFISPEPGKPFKSWELSVYKDSKLIACSFMDITPQSLSSTYAMYDLNESKRSLGIYTMILEMMHGMAKKKKFYYPGYAYVEPSFYDYKKKFDNTEYFDWTTKMWCDYKYNGQ